MPTRKYRVCVRKNIKKETRFLCAQCGVPLHPEGSYTRYQTLKRYWRYVLNFKSLSHIVFVYLFTEISKEGAADHLNGWHFNAPGYLTFWRRDFLLILAHHVYKMWIMQEPNMLELWNKLHFEEGKNGECIPRLKYFVPIFVE